MATNSQRRKSAYDLTKPQFVAPQTRQEANDWLASATFGAATARTDIAASTKTNIVPLAGEVDDAVRLMSIGYAAYVAEQQADTSIFNMLVPNATTGFPEYIAARFGQFPNNNLPTTTLFSWFYSQAIHGSAQIRLKTLYALSQIFVINTNTQRIDDFQYYDNMMKATISNNTSTYRQLLSDVVYSTSMTYFLTYNNNKKEDLATNRVADQNFMRELWQLFGAGLVHLNLDGTPILDSSGNQIPLYDQSYIYEGSWVFTSMLAREDSKFGIQELYFEDTHERRAKKLPPYTPGGADGSIPATSGTYFKPLEYPPNRAGYLIKNVTATTFEVDLSSPHTQTRVVNVGYSLSSAYTGVVASTMQMTTGAFNAVITTSTAHGLTNGTRIYAYSTAQRSVELMMDYLFGHPTVPAFFAKNMIKMFVTSNPTPDYVKRVALKFIDNGNGVRGDISAVVKAILLDKEAIVPFGVNPNNHGRHMPLIERELATIRAFRNENVHVQIADWSVADGSRLTDFTVFSPIFTKPTHILQHKSVAITDTGSFQFSKSPSVFNFGRPGYTPPSTILGTLGQTAPELQTNTLAAQTFWFNAISRMCETELFGGRVAVKSNDISRFGLDFNLTPANVFTVTAVTASSVTFQGTFNNAITGSNNTKCVFIRRSDRKKYYSDGFARPLGGGVQSFTINSDFFFNAGTIATVAVNDMFDFFPRFELGFHGFPSNQTDAQYGFNPAIFTFNKLASLMTNVSTTPTLADCNIVIDYIDTLMRRPISAQTRALMVQAGQLTATEGNPQITGDASYANQYLNLISTRAQKRVRRMVHILLASPEYSTQR